MNSSPIPADAKCVSYFKYFQQMSANWLPK